MSLEEGKKEFYAKTKAKKKSKCHGASLSRVTRGYLCGK
jgi:hypothetical protein